MKTIDTDIKSNTFASVYLLYGEERYLKRQYKDKLANAILPADDTMNRSSFDGKDVKPAEVIDLAETLPFFAERRLLILTGSGLMKSGGEELSDYMKNIPPFTYFLFVEDEVDKRSKLYKSVKAAGRVVEFPRQTQAVLSKWILMRLKKENKQITETALHSFLQAVGDDMDYIEKELEKLLCYTMGKDSIEDSDIADICVFPVTNHIFDMINAMAERNPTKTLSYYYELLALKEAPMRILFLIVRQFRILMMVKELAGASSAEIASKVGIPPFTVKKDLMQAKSFSKERLKEAFFDCGETEEAVKSGRLGDRLGVELLLVRYSTP
ncbi:DNA polymerase III subunit delta [Clostridia bacterium]|nr:DNA polymerase III subunit delta [Clostridia bacterium]